MALGDGSLRGSDVVAIGHGADIP